MDNVVDIYTDAVYSNLRPFRANWEPSQPISLGDYGTLDGEVFSHLGNVGTLGIAIGQSITDNAQDQKIFSSGRNTSLAFNAKAATSASSPVTGNANVSISFSSEKSAFFNAAGCSYSMIADKAKLATSIMALYDAGKWRREWAVVTDLVHSTSTTIVISSADNASIVLEADASVTNVDLANANLGLTIKSATNVGYQVISKNGLTPLIGLSKIQPSFLWMGNDFKPLRATVMASPYRVRSLQDSISVQTEPREYLAFSQLD